LLADTFASIASPFNPTFSPPNASSTPRTRTRSTFEMLVTVDAPDTVVWL